VKTLIVEDDAATRRAIEKWVRDGRGEARSVGTAGEALRAIESYEPHVLIVDIALPDGDGLEVLRKARETRPETDAIVVTGSSALDHAVEALRAGATDYLLKPFRPAQLEAVFDRIAERRRLEDELDAVRAELQEKGRLGEMVGCSSSMQTLFEVIRKVARSEAPILITGPSGSGKEVAARTIHKLSRRAGKAFVAFNCGAVSPTLIESELFGHEKGSFTGADRRRIGYFEEASGGTLFLDEITEMSAELQVRLLRVLEERTIRRVGGSEELRTDVRLLSATNRDPMEAVREGKLREDLYYRLNVFPLRLPPLKDRPEDIPLLVEHFRRQIENDEKRGVERWDGEALELLQGLEWPGNVRQLRNIVHRAHIVADGESVSAAAVEQVLAGSERGERAGSSARAKGGASRGRAGPPGTRSSGKGSPRRRSPRR
jgi:two-component system, NtrC family, response regulator AtoC